MAGLFFLKVVNSMKECKGEKFGRLLVLEDFFKTVKGNKKAHYCICKCDCGNEKIVSANHLRTGHTLSCGCLHKEQLSERVSTHKQTGKRLYNIYLGMKYRCYTKTCKRYNDYGGRGIVICKEWLEDFLSFKKWAEENGYNENLTIDRIDNNGNYEPSNCRWITKEEQQRNKRNNVFYCIDGERLNVGEIERRYKIDRHKIRKLILEGKTIEQIIKVKE